MPSMPLPILIAFHLAAAAATAQGTVPHWSTYFGGTGLDQAMVVKRGPGSLITVVGHTDSDQLGTAGVHKQFLGQPGNIDAFVARFDMSQPPAQQKVWCTYFGGNAMELAFDAVVDAAGGVTIVGLTQSDAASFVVQGGAQATRKGPSDGFVARFSNTGALTYSTYFGSNADDRICALDVDANGRVTVLGVAEGSGLLVTAGVVGPTHQGGNDAFVARIDPAATGSNQVVWSTYVGGPANEGGFALSSWGGWNVQYEGLLDAMALHVEPSGSIVLATASQSSNLPTPGGFQPTHAAPGLNNIYLARLSPGATSVQYGTYFGGSGNGVRDMVPHPAGGFVLVGQAAATNLPTTPNCFQPTHWGGPNGGNTDGTICWIDPSLPASQQLHYSSYLGGDGGEDGMFGVAVESSGIVTVIGYLSGGFTPRSTPGALQTTSSPFEFAGWLARLAMNGNGVDDLLYATYLGQPSPSSPGTIMQDVALDECGDAIAVGGTYAVLYPTSPNAHQPAHGGPGLRDAVITHLPLMAGGTTRFGGAFATPACAQRMYHGTFGTPISPPINPNLAFALSVTNAPPAGVGTIVFGLTPLPGAVPVPGLGIHALVFLDILGATVTSDALGFARYALPIPAGLPPGFTVDSQGLFLTNAACPGTGPFATSEGLRLTTL